VAGDDWALAGRRSDAPKAQPFDLTAFAEAPPENIGVIESGTVEIGGASGFRVRFTFDDAVDCAGQAVCEYWLLSETPFPPASMRIRYQYELLHLDTGLADPLTIVVETHHERWFDHAQELFDTIEFDQSS